MNTNYLVLVNKDNKLPDNWLDTIELTYAKDIWGEDMKIEKETRTQFRKLREKLFKDKIYLLLDSAHREIFEQEYIWNKCFDSNKLKNENFLVATALIRKKDFFEVNGYELREKAVNEDWNFWLKMVAKEKFPVRMNYYAFWYRRKDNIGELAKANQNKQRTMEIISETIKNIHKEVTAIEYPKYDYNWNYIID